MDVDQQISVLIYVFLESIRHQIPDARVEFLDARTLRVTITGLTPAAVRTDCSRADKLAEEAMLAVSNPPLLTSHWKQVAVADAPISSQCTFHLPWHVLLDHIERHSDLDPRIKRDFLIQYFSSSVLKLGKPSTLTSRPEVTVLGMYDNEELGYTVQIILAGDERHHLRILIQRVAQLAAKCGVEPVDAEWEFSYGNILPPHNESRRLFYFPTTSTSRVNLRALVGKN